MYLSIIVPAYNEERNVRRTLEDIYGYLRVRSIDHEIILVVNGSEDGTATIARSMLAGVTTLKLIELQQSGKGLAVKAGMLNASGDFRLFTDADNSTSIDHLERMMPYFDDGYAVVIGSIAVSGTEITAGSEPVWRRVLGKLGNLFIQFVAVPGIADTQRGFKIFTAEAAREIFSRLTIKRWGFDVEALALARRLGFRVKEVPVTWDNNPNSHVRLTAYLEVLVDTLAVRWNLLTGAYGDGVHVFPDPRALLARGTSAPLEPPGSRPK